MIFSNPYYSDVPNLAQRNRFNPFLFKGTVFSSGGYSALYGQGLSGALILESVDLPLESSAFFGLSSVGADDGYEHLFNSGKASVGGTYSYVNLQSSEEHTSELQTIMRISYDTLCLKKTKTNNS